MATNPAKHHGGQVSDRSQVYNPKNDHWVKRDSGTGKFIDQKANDKPFKGSRRIIMWSCEARSQFETRNRSIPSPIISSTTPPMLPIFLRDFGISRMSTH